MKHIFTISLCFLTLSLSAQVDCPNTFDNNSDGAVTINDLLDLLAVFGDTDTDSDGVWDSIDDCIDLTACNYANDPTEACNYIDVLGNCGGGCEGDSDNDGICDSEDDCVGVLDECGVCNGPGATEVVIESITILYDSVYAEAIDNWFVFEVGADTAFTYVCPNLFQSCGDLVSHEGYDYSTVLIGDQCWFAENCRYLPSVSPYNDIIWGDERYYYVYGYEGTDVEAAMTTPNYSTYGVLYNWPASTSGLCCPSGWHVPSDAEFTQLTDFLGGESIAGPSMKSTYGWNNGANGSNSSGFNGLPGGLVNSDGFYGGGSNGFWWSSSFMWGGPDAWMRRLQNSDNVVRDIRNFDSGLSARCVIDYTDECGVLNGDNSTCLDECGVPNGDNSTCFTGCGDGIMHEGYDYSTVQIGDQCWFAENCRYLPEVSPSSEGSDTAPYYYVYDYQGTDVEAAKSTSNYETYGVLYNWPAVMEPGICPSGWHIPTDGEFTELTDFLGGQSVAGYAMKSTSGWYNNGNGSNSSGWTGLPGGYRYSGGFDYSGNDGYWWSASVSGWEYGAGSNSWRRLLDYYSGGVSRNNGNWVYGYSARCVRD
jgi:uncharacterized protein (TIGR02145 family)